MLKRINPHVVLPWFLLIMLATFGGYYWFDTIRNDRLQLIKVTTEIQVGALREIEYLVARHVLTPAQEQAVITAIVKGGRYDPLNLYYFVYTQDGTVVAHGASPDFVGKNLRDPNKTGGVPVVETLLRLSTQGGGFYEYLWRNKDPITGRLESIARKKIGYANNTFYIDIPSTANLMVGTGLYMDTLWQEYISTSGWVAAAAAIIMIIVLLSLLSGYAAREARSLREA